MRVILAIFFVVGLSLIPAANAAPAQSAQHAVCAPTYTIVAAAAIGAGDINFCVYFSPQVASSSSTVVMTSIITAPPAVVPVFLAATSAFTVSSGCTEGTPAMAVPTTNGLVGTQAVYSTTLTMTSEQCTGTAAVTLTIAAIPLQIYFTSLAFTIQTENYRVDNHNYLCDGTGEVPNSFSTTTTTCNPVDFAADVNITVAENITISGNQTEDGNGPVGFNGSLYVLVMIFALALAHLGESRRDNNYRVIAGFITLVAGFIVVWELDRLGFNNVLGGYGLGFSIVWIGIHFWIATVLMLPKNWSVKTNE